MDTHSVLHVNFLKMFSENNVIFSTYRNIRGITRKITNILIHIAIIDVRHKAYQNSSTLAAYHQAMLGNLIG